MMGKEGKTANLLSGEYIKCAAAAASLSAQNTRFSFILAWNLHVRFHLTAAGSVFLSSFRHIFYSRNVEYLACIDCSVCVCYDRIAEALQACILRNNVLHKDQQKRRWNKVSFICCSNVNARFVTFHRMGNTKVILNLRPLQVYAEDTEQKKLQKQ